MNTCGNNTLCTGPLTSPPKFTCACMPGFWSPNNNGTNCIANLCTLNNGGCGKGNICVQDPESGYVNCSCKPGYFERSGDIGFTCIKNPCVANGTLCGDNSACIPALSFFFSCLCNKGYESNFTLAYGNCSLYTDQCSGGSYCAQSSNLPDSFVCANGIINGNYKAVYPCMAINICRTNNGGCSDNCVFTGPGTRNCTCNQGSVLSADGTTCKSSATASSSSSTLGIGVGVSIGLLVLLLLLVMILRMRNRHNRPKPMQPEALALQGKRVAIYLMSRNAYVICYRPELSPVEYSHWS